MQQMHILTCITVVSPKTCVILRVYSKMSHKFTPKISSAEETVSWHCLSFFSAFSLVIWAQWLLWYEEHALKHYTFLVKEQKTFSSTTLRYHFPLFYRLFFARTKGFIFSLKRRGGLPVKNWKGGAAVLTKQLIPSISQMKFFPAGRQLTERNVFNEEKSGLSTSPWLKKGNVLGVVYISRLNASFFHSQSSGASLWKTIQSLFSPLYFVN